jgi:probable HAF family extracellular repeat protein
VRPLPPPAAGGRATYVVGINDRGQIAGGGVTAAGQGVVARWNVRGGVTNLGIGQATAINADGVIAGTAPPQEDSLVPAYVWRGTTRTTIGDFGGGGSAPSAINDRGVVAGTSRAADFNDYAFLWRDGRLTRLPSSGISSNATALNNRCQVIVSTGEDGFYVWDAGRRIPVPRAGYNTGGWPVDINERGQMAGSIVTDETFTTRRAVLWTIRR